MAIKTIQKYQREGSAMSMKLNREQQAAATF
jgi:hypothetical protein